MHADRSNRLLLTVIGVVALALGVGGLLAAAGAYGSACAGSYLTDNAFCRYIGRHGDWVWPAIAGVALVVTVLALLWLARLLFSTDRTGDIRLTPARSADQPRRGCTTMLSAALVDAVTDEISGYHGITAARGRVLGEPARPVLALDLSASRRADLPELIRRIGTEAVDHARTAVDQADLRVVVNLAVNDRGVAREH